MEFGSVLFDAFMAPLERAGLALRRRELLQQASGRVLEIGVGSGANLSFFRRGEIQSYTGLDLELSERTHRRVRQWFPNATLVSASVEDLPFAEDSFDTVVFTLVFCSVDDPEKGLAEVRRVLAPGGRVLFLEHVAPLHRPWRPLFHAATPAWRRVASGCRLNRETVAALRQAGFLVEVRERFNGVFVSGVAACCVDTP